MPESQLGQPAGHVAIGAKQRGLLAGRVLIGLVLVAGALWLVLSHVAFDVDATLEFEVPLATATVGRDVLRNELLTTQALVVKSRSNCELAVARVSQARSGQSDVRVPELVDELCDELEVRPVPGASALRLRVHHEDARLGRLFVDAVGEAYLERVTAPQSAASKPAATVNSELVVVAASLTQAEQDVGLFAQEHGLLGYDTQVGLQALAPLREELTQARIHLTELQAQTAHLESAVQSKTYQASPLSSDPAVKAIREQLDVLTRNRALSKAAGDDVAESDARIEALSALLGTVAQRRLAEQRAELVMARDQERRLSALLESEQGALAQKELDLIELRRRQRALAAQEATYQAFFEDPSIKPLVHGWSARFLDRAHVQGKSVSRCIWSGAVLLLLSGLAALTWRVLGPLVRRSSAIHGS
jgi:hypothetical protein